LLHQRLTTAGYRVEEASRGQAALRRVAERQFDLLILVVDEPTNPIALLRALSTTPILALSVRDDEVAAANALENGADDYVSKPFDVNELLARAKIVLRRKARQQNKPALFTTGALEIDLLYRRVRRCGQEIHLPVKAYEVLHVLAAGAGKVLRISRSSARFGAGASQPGRLFAHDDPGAAPPARTRSHPTALCPD
jgi:two-component system, OmpR family, KDP operon response regulator KdpE